MENGPILPKYRIVILGSSKVGKTNLIIRYLNNTFQDEYNPTNGLEYNFIKSGFT
jgi:GTPase SAR1 family protein